MIVIIYNNIDHRELCISLKDALIHSYSQEKILIINKENINVDYKWNEDTLYFFVDLHHFNYLKKMPKKYIIYNYQQLPYRPIYGKFGIFLDKAIRALQIWDYSKLNIKAIKKQYNLSVQYVPFGFTPSFRYVGPELERNYEIGFIGQIKPRRQKILKQIESSLGIKVSVPTKIYGNQKYKFQSQCKIILNIHKLDESGILESSRLISSIANGALLISENSNDQQLINDFKDKIVLVDRGDLIPQIKYFLNHPEEREKKAKDAQNWLINKYQYHRVVPNIEKFL